MSKTLGNTDMDKTQDNVSDVKFWPYLTKVDTFQLISKASSQKEGWMKSTKAMELPGGIGCVIQVTTQQGDNVAEALTYVPGVMIKTTHDKLGEVVKRELIVAKL